MGPHPLADDRDLGDLRGVCHLRRADRLCGEFGDSKGLAEISPRHREADLGFTFLRRVLNDHVHDDMSGGDAGEDPVHDPGAVGHASDRDPRLVLRERRSRDHDAKSSGVGLGDDPGPFRLVERASNVDRDAVFLGELDRARVHHSRPQAREFEHLVVADPIDLASLGHDPRIGGEDPRDVGINLASLGAKHGGESDGGGVGTPSAKGGDVVILVHPLKARDDHDLAFTKGLDHALGGDVANPGLRVKAVGHQADLCSGEADRGDPERLDRHRHERDADLLAGGEEHVHLSGRRPLGDFFRQGDQFIRGMPARGDDHKDLFTTPEGTDRTFRGGENSRGIGDARAAEFLDQQSHFLTPVYRMEECGRRMRNGVVGRDSSFAIRHRTSQKFSHQLISAFVSRAATVFCGDLVVCQTRGGEPCTSHRPADPVAVVGLGPQECRVVGRDQDSIISIRLQRFVQRFDDFLVDLFEGFDLGFGPSFVAGFIGRLDVNANQVVGLQGFDPVASFRRIVRIKVSRGTRHVDPCPAREQADTPHKVDCRHHRPFQSMKFGECGKAGRFALPPEPDCIRGTLTRRDSREVDRMVSDRHRPDIHQLAKEV